MPRGWNLGGQSSAKPGWSQWKARRRPVQVVGVNISATTGISLCRAPGLDSGVSLAWGGVGSFRRWFGTYKFRIMSPFAVLQSGRSNPTQMLPPHPSVVSRQSGLLVQFSNLPYIQSLDGCADSLDSLFGKSS